MISKKEHIPIFSKLENFILKEVVVKIKNRKRNEVEEVPSIQHKAFYTSRSNICNNKYYIKRCSNLLYECSFNFNNKKLIIIIYIITSFTI